MVTCSSVSSPLPNWADAAMLCANPFKTARCLDEMVMRSLLFGFTFMPRRYVVGAADG
jgi:hypothetical protein